MRPSPLFLVGGLAALMAALLAPPSARACSQLLGPAFQPDALRFAEVDGEVATDGVFVVSGQVDETRNDFTHLEVRVARKADDLIVHAAQDVDLAQILGQQGLWRPETALEPDTEYAVQVRRIDRDGQTLGVVLQRDFTTGSEALPALNVAGEPSLRLEYYDKQTQQCAGEDSCGGGFDCTDVVQRTLRARISLPAVGGGFVADRYSVEAAATQPSGAWITREVMRIEPGTAQELSIDLPQDMAVDEACVRLTLTDDSDRLQEVFLGCNAVPDDETAPPSRAGSGGCSVGERNGDTLLGLAFALLAISRRRSGCDRTL